MRAAQSILSLLGIGVVAAIAWQGLRGDPPPLEGSGAIDATGPRRSEAIDTVNGDEPSGPGRSAVAQPSSAAGAPPAGVHDSTPEPVAPTGATLTGVVVAPDGTPVPGAEVVTGRIVAFRDYARGKEAAASIQLVVADDEGRFEIHGLLAGPVHLTARADGFAYSIPELVLVTGNGTGDGSGEGTEDGAGDGIRLVLRSGAELAGTVYAPDGRPAAGREITLMETSVGTRQEASADEQGWFEARALVPGTWNLVSIPTKDELAGAGIEGDPMLHVVQLKIELADGERREVELGKPPENPVRVHGRVELRGEPVKGILQWFGEGPDAVALQKVGRTKSDGTYELVLDGPGPWYASFHGGGGRIETVVQVPEVAELEHDIVLPEGRITGRVRSAAGTAAPDLTVFLHVEGGTSRRTPMSLGSDTQRTGPDGRFAFDVLAPGTYSVSIAGRTATDDAPAMAMAIARGIVVELGSEPREVELILTEGITIRGVVRDEEGLAAAHAVVFLRDGAGRAINPASSIRTGEDGRFESPLIAPGTYTVQAWAADRASEVSAPFAVSDEDVELELMARPAVRLRVVTVQVEPGATPLLSIVDAAGRQHGGLLDPRRPWDWLAGGYASTAQLTGPLPPGRYEVRAKWPSGDSSPIAVEALAGETIEVRIPE